VLITVHTSQYRAYPATRLPPEGHSGAPQDFDGAPATVCRSAFSLRRRSRKRKAVARRSPVKVAATVGPATAQTRHLIHVRQTAPTCIQRVPLLTAFGARAAITLESTERDQFVCIKEPFVTPCVELAIDVPFTSTVNREIGGVTG